MVRQLIAIPVLLSLLATESRAQPDPRTEKAREHYLQADAYYKVDKYREALGEYEQAYIAKPDPSFLYNIGQCHRLMGNKADALRFYRRYLKDAPNAPNRLVTEKQIRELDAALANSVPLVDEPMRLPRANGVPATNAPTGASATAAGATGAGPTPSPSSASVSLSPTLTSAADTTPGASIVDAPSPSSRDADSRPPVYTRWWFWTAVGAAVVGGVVIAVAASRDPNCPAGRLCE